MNDGGSVLRVGVSSALSHVDPLRFKDLSTELICRQVFETPFVTIDEQGTTLPLLFAGPLEPTVHQGRSGYCGRLRPDLRFRDGSPVTIERAFECVRDGLAGTGDESVALVEERIFIAGDGARDRLEKKLTNLRTALFKVEGSVALGTGPFAEVENRSGRFIALERNPHSRVASDLSRIEFTYFPPDSNGRPEALLSALRSGAIDLTMDLSRSDPKLLEGYRQVLGTGYSTALLYFNTERAPFDDPEVRRAVAQGIDRLEFTRLFYQRALAFVATNLLPPALGRQNDGLIASPATARRVLGHRPPTERRLRLLSVWAPRPYLPDPARANDWIRARLEELGFSVEVLKPRTPQEFDALVESAEYDLALAGWQIDTLEPADFLEVCLSAQAVVPRGAARDNRSGNLSRFVSVEMESALTRYAREHSPAALEAALRVVAHEVPLLPLMYGSTLVVHSAQVRGCKLDSMGFPSFAEVRLGR
jgi:ABC-type oligopeptide transport system substrate-binding subunit